MPTVSVWLESRDEEFRETCKHNIATLAERFDTAIFEPHVTVVGGFACDLELAGKEVQSLATSHSPFDVNFDGFGFESVPVRAGYLKASVSPQLQALHDDAKMRFGLNKPPYMPHLSLLYAENVDESDRVDEFAKLGVVFPVKTTFSRLSLWQTELGDPIDFAGWQRIDEFPLSPAGGS